MTNAYKVISYQLLASDKFHSFENDRQTVDDNAL